MEARAISSCDVARRAGAPIQRLGLGVAPVRPRIHRGGATDWVLTRLEDDPLFQHGPFPIPRSVRRHLKRLDRALIDGGLSMDALAVAHEVPASRTSMVLSSSSSSTDSTSATSSSSEASSSARIVEVSPTQLPSLITHPGPARTTRDLARTAGEVAGRLGSAAGSIALAPTALLDPVVFGLHHVPGHPHLAMVYELARWDW